MLAGRAPSRSSRPRPLPVARRHRAFAAAQRSCHPRERRAFDPRNRGSMPQPECAPP
ncbi:hypothetical protein BURPSPAST_R0127 [Burkholderia pseudomallei Pasteur 52237]|nr:hypothetical protein BURPSPAST_R0127 [Burkholderia pseudomallei Pasteur 52237]